MLKFMLNQMEPLNQPFTTANSGLLEHFSLTHVVVSLKFFIFNVISIKYHLKLYIL